MLVQSPILLNDHHIVIIENISDYTCLPKHQFNKQPSQIKNVSKNQFYEVPQN